MVSKNDEAQKCANTLGLLSNKSQQGNIDMNIVQNKELTFHNVTMNPAPVKDGVWLTSADIAKALGYASSKSVSTIYSRNSDEFTSSMSMVIKMKTNGINNNLREKSVRVFSLRGCHLIAMFATTKVAKDFRKWVLDILDREVATGNVNPAFDFAMYAHNARVADRHLEVIYKEWRENLKPALRAVGSPIANNLDDRIKAIGSITCGLASALSKHEIKGKIH